jgi:F0F1-type ATP synthase membrane subunit b/b'
VGVTDTEIFLRALGLLMLLCVWVITRSFVKHMRARNRYVDQDATDAAWHQQEQDEHRQLEQENDDG